MSEASLEVMTIPSDPERFREVRAWLLEVARAAGLPGQAAHDAALAVNEICANIHRHAYAGDRSGRIDLSAESDLACGRLRLTVRDYGATFDARAVPPPAPDLQERGYGVFLVKNLMDEVEWTNMGIGTRVVLVKRVKATGVCG
ncbi:MAG TPA: ATP-binding protein [Candidatus Polarisedimenticolaceae bacterium]|nr:ATP-binding protein [Candidatus Polarisedimenticolaceae bacterium]